MFVARIQKQQASCEKLSGVSIEASIVGGGAIPREEKTRERVRREGRACRHAKVRGVPTPRSGEKKKNRSMLQCSGGLGSVLRRTTATSRSCSGVAFVQEGDESLRMQRATIQFVQRTQGPLQELYIGQSNLSRV